MSQPNNRSKDPTRKDWFEQEMDAIKRDKELKEKGFSKDVLENIKKSWNSVIEIPK